MLLEGKAETSQSGNYTTTVDDWRPLAERGNAEAQCNLGDMYLSGHGVFHNESEAVKWYRRAAEQCHANAQLNLGNMYLNGHGVAKSEGEAIKWLRLSAQQGNADAQLALSNLYYNGTGVTRNPVMALMLEVLAAKQGVEQARKKRDVSLKHLSHEQITEGQRMANEWRLGTPLPHYNDFITYP